MKLKKGSKEAKEFMSKIRARKKQKNLPDRKYKKINLEIKPIQKIQGVKKSLQTYDIYFNDEYNSNNKGFKESLIFCKKYIKMYNGSKESYFADYKNGYVQIINNQTNNTVYSTKVK